MLVLATAADHSAAEGLALLALVIIGVAVLVAPFQRRIGGRRGGSEKAIVGALWLLAAIVLGIALAV